MQPTPEWTTYPTPVPYPDALTAMEARVEQIIRKEAAEAIWLLEHPPLYTAGTSANSMDLLDKSRFPIYQAGRGGQFTYHGPGQRIAYLMLDLKARAASGTPDIRRYVQQLEHWLIAVLAGLGVEAFTREGRIGVWVYDAQGREAKIAALGIRVRKWVTYHGISLNINPDLSHYRGIVPCGIQEYGVTSLEMLGIDVSMECVDQLLHGSFSEYFAA